MSDKNDTKGGGLAGSTPMVIHKHVEDAAGVGKRDSKTGRYIPVSGGSRTRLPVFDDPRVPRYPAFVGVNASQSEDIYTMPALYRELAGMPVVPKPGQGSKLAGLVAERRPKEEEDDLAL